MKACTYDMEEKTAKARGKCLGVLRNIQIISSIVSYKLISKSKRTFLKRYVISSKWNPQFMVPCCSGRNAHLICSFNQE